MKFLVGRNFSQRPKIKSLFADFFFTDKVPVLDPNLNYLLSTTEKESESRDESSPSEVFSEEESHVSCVEERERRVFVDMLFTSITLWWSDSVTPISPPGGRKKHASI